MGYIGPFVEIYSNDGSSLLFDSDTYSVDSSGVVTDPTITEKGVDFINTQISTDYIYSGGLKFLGLATEPNATEPTYVIGDTLPSNADYYIVESLTNTTWYVPSGWYIEVGKGKFNVEGNFTHCITSDFATAESFKFAGIDFNVSNAYSMQIYYADNADFTSSSIGNGRYLMFSFTGGTDVANPDLISWLTTYGTQLKVTDLTNTTWHIYQDFSCPNPVIYSINGIYQSYNSFNEFRIGYYYYNNAFGTSVNDICFVGDTVSCIPNDFSGSSHLVVTFTGGTDATNPALIAWLSKYGELQAEETPTITDLTGYTVTVPAGWNGSILDDLFYDVSGTVNGQSFIYIEGAGSDYINFLPMPDEDYLVMTPSSGFVVSFNGGTETDSEYLIQFFVENNATFEKTETQTLTIINSNNPSETATFTMPKGYTFEQFIGSEYDTSGGLFSVGADNERVRYDGILLTAGDPYILVTETASGTFYYDGAAAETPELTTLTIWGSDDYVIKTYNVPVGITFEELANSKYNDGAFSVVGDAYKEAYYNGLGMSMKMVGGNSPVAIGIYASHIANDVVDGVTYQYYGTKAEEETPTITDLTGTNWYVQSGWEVEAGYGGAAFIVDGEIKTTNGVNTLFTNLWLGASPNNQTLVENTIAHRYNTSSTIHEFTNTEGFVIYITGGEDATDPDLIAWFSDRGKLLTCELSGTWVFNEELTEPPCWFEQKINWSSVEDPDKWRGSMISITSDAIGKFLTFHFLYNNSAPSYQFATDTLSGGWSETNGSYVRKISFGPTPQSASKWFYDWFTANAVKQEVQIWYNGILLATIEEGQTVILHTNGKKAITDIVIENAVVHSSRISFTINDTTYYAEEGMTWAEWVESEYNTGGFEPGAWTDLVRVPNSGYYIYDESTSTFACLTSEPNGPGYVNTDPNITANTAYTLKYLEHSNGSFD